MTTEIHQVENPKQVNAILDRVMAQNLYALVSGAGVLVMTSSEVAIEAFRKCALSYGRICGHEFEILSVQDPTGRDAIGFAVNTNAALYLYGVDPHALMLALAEHVGPMQ
jgi:hypothetical protein